MTIYKIYYIHKLATVCSFENAMCSVKSVDILIYPCVVFGVRIELCEEFM